MRALHDSRDADYRFPYGAVTPKTPVKLSIDVWDAGCASATLRTWTDDAGEGLIPMQPVDGASDGAQRFEAALTPSKTGFTWYHFIIRDEWGNEQRYGAREGHTGGVGQLYGWEPPSFQLTAHTAKPSAPTWHAAQQPEGQAAPCQGIAQLDPDMDYPLADALVQFIMGGVSAYDFAEALETLRESYPEKAFGHALAKLASHDLANLYARFANVDPQEKPVKNAKPLDMGRLGLAKGRLWCAMLVQQLALRAPLPIAESLDTVCDDLCDYVGALAGREDRDCESIVRNVADAHRTLPAFAQGDVSFVAYNDDVLGIWRRAKDEDPVCILVNRSLSNAHDVLVPLAAGAVSETIGGYAVGIVDAPAGEKRPGASIPHAQVHLNQLGSALLLFHEPQRLQQPMQPGLGVLAHVTSLPTENAQAPSTIGAPARAFVDWLADAGAAYWQILPVNPTDEHGSPYAGISAFAGNATLLDPDDDIDALVKANENDYRAFCDREQDWLAPYAWFMAIRQKVGSGKTWQKWPAAYRTYKPETFAEDAELTSLAEQCQRTQFAFDLRWKQLRAYANEHGVKIVGDMPIYVSADSSDVWANPQIFQLGRTGVPSVVAGCPPDNFAKDGQVWGNPVYDWARLADDGYDWWLRRLKRAFDLYDVVRLDHFIGFARYFAIPKGKKATAGTWHAGPGLELFRAAYDAYGPLPVIAEDLGLITPAVRALVAACGFPGMDIAQFVDGNDPLSGYRPRPEKIAYTGTHDNRTLVGYAAERYPDVDAREATRRLTGNVASCGADVCVFPLQDLMGLDDEARMNTPGTTKGNWAWKAQSADMAPAQKRLRELVELHQGAIVNK